MQATDSLRVQRQAVRSNIVLILFSPLTSLHNNTFFLHTSFQLTNSIVPLGVTKGKATELHHQHMAVPFFFNEIYDSKWTSNIPK